MNFTYFDRDDRRGKVKDFSKPIIDAFNYIYKDDIETKERNLAKELKNYSDIKDHPFLGKFLLDAHQIDYKIENENEKTDIVLFNYLNKMSVFTNPEYFTRLIIFVTLFREYVNIAKKGFQKANEEYTAFNCAEDVPDVSNEFINDFLEPEKNMFGFNKEECIDLTQNVCHWMYENNFTCSKLSLINGYSAPEEANANQDAEDAESGENHEEFKEANPSI